MKYSTPAIVPIFLLLSQHVLAQEWFTILTIYPEGTCGQDGEKKDIEAAQEGCSGGSYGFPDPPWDVDDTNPDLVNFYADTSTVPDDCKVIFWDRNVQTGVDCAVPRAVFTKSYQCLKTSHYANAFNVGYCCGDRCDGIVEAKVSPPNESAPVSQVPDVTAIKRTHPLARRQVELDGCTFNPQGDMYLDSFTPAIRVAPVGICTNEEGCEYSADRSMALGYQETFGTSAEAGVNILDVVQASVSFSYSETYSETTTATVHYGVTIQNGQQGYVAFSPTYECYAGGFAGDNCQAETGKDGMFSSIFDHSLPTRTPFRLLSKISKRKTTFTDMFSHKRLYMRAQNTGEWPRGWCHHLRAAGQKPVDAQVIAANPGSSKSEHIPREPQRRLYDHSPLASAPRT